ncbi:MAG: hypothetical protein MUC59_15160 [Saprospiraceae bacterium]|jgi:hypothetical protein|nr:hypothetical protein [Saprospiraceae bacterium]
MDNIGIGDNLMRNYKPTNMLVYACSFVLFLPFLFINIRLTAFDTVPIDDYVGFILSMDGQLPDFEYYSPQGYRWFYYSIGFLFYKIVPLLQFTNMEVEGNLANMKANQALMIVSFLFLHCFFFINYLLVKIKLGKSLLLSIATAFAVFVFSLSMAFYGIDPLTLSFTSLLLFFLNKPAWFCPLLIVSIFINEKISLLFLAFFSIGFLFSRADKTLVTKLLTAVAAVGIYFMERAYFKYPGYEYQTDPSQFLDRATISIPYLLGLKGVYMNWLPLIILLVMLAAFWRLGVFEINSAYCSKSLFFMPIAFFVLGVFTCSDYGIGRAAFHVLPFFTVPMAFALERFSEFDLKTTNN